MNIAQIRRDTALCKVLGVGCISARILIADSGNCKLSGFPADHSGLYAVRNTESRIFFSLVNPGHDLSPDILVEGGSAVS